MNLLLDVQPVLYFFAGDPRLPTRVRHMLESGEHTFSLSVVSVWEIIIKLALRKLDIAPPAMEIVDRCRDELGAKILDVRLDHVLDVGSLPSIHADPFDRLLVAQAKIEGLPILTGDAAIRRYGVKTVW